MPRLLFIMLVSLKLMTPVHAQDSSSAIKGVIASQIEAFQRDDLAGAFTFASPAIREIFRTPDNFGRMVRNGFPMVWRPAEVQFLGLRESDGAIAQVVLIRDAKGVYHALEYQMIMTADGWQINAVQLLELPLIGV